jgi:hypothetical protein
VVGRRQMAFSFRFWNAKSYVHYLDLIVVGLVNSNLPDLFLEMKRVERRGTLESQQATSNDVIQEIFVEGTQPAEISHIVIPVA